jgi:hypothetical protein
MAHIHIERRHQSAPAETPADKAVALAAEEIDKGQWKPSAEALNEIDAVPGMALRTGTQEYLKQPYTQADFDQTDESLILGEHPRVQEALAKLEQERDESKNGQEYAERTAMIHETIENRKAMQRWAGQERWAGRENQEMRYGLVLTPLEFYDRLMRLGLRQQNPLSLTRDFPVRQTEWVDDVELVGGRAVLGRRLVSQELYVRTIGSGRILLARDCKLVRKGQHSGRVALLVMARSDKAPEALPGAAAHPDEPVQVATLQWPQGTEWMIMRFDEFGVPRTPKYIGWRTALLALVRTCVITPDEANRAFPVSNGPAGAWYRQQLFEWGARR